MAIQSSTQGRAAQAHAAHRRPVVHGASGEAPSVVGEHATARLLAVTEVCDRLGVTRSTWNKWRGRGDTPRVVKLPNGSLRIRECDLAAWVEGRFA